MGCRSFPESRRSAALLAALLVTVVATKIGWAQAPTLDALLLRLFDVNVKEPYELSADFNGTLDVTVKRSRLVVAADGSFLEWRGTDGIRHRSVTVHDLTLPLLLRPFASSIRKVIAEKIETQGENPETFYAHDIFLLSEQPGGRFVLAGVHRAIVDDAIDRYGRPEDKLDVTTRRKIAQWLYTAPNMKEFIARPGPPYALRATIDENGVLYELVLSYDWGEVSTRIGYIWINGQPVWAEVQADTVSNLAGVGRVIGQLVLRFTNHCVNCKRPGP